jgi:hypothetical protein
MGKNTLIQMWLRVERNSKFVRGKKKVGVEVAKLDFAAIYPINRKTT